ncbi:hypothetical protein SCYAM73S_00174 [Streptomyces cyaneofuscatus]
MNSAGRSKASAAKTPMSSEAMNCIGLSGLTGSDITRSPSTSAKWSRLFMKNTGRRMVAGRPSALMWRSISALLSKWSMPVSRSAPPTEL